MILIMMAMMASATVSKMIVWYVATGCEMLATMDNMTVKETLCSLLVAILVVTVASFMDAIIAISPVLISPSLFNYLP